MIWKPNTTVAAIIEEEGRFLMVEENTTEGVRINQPAGHLDEGETILEAVSREVLEETGHEFRATELLGIYLWQRPAKDITYLRFAFVGKVGAHYPELGLDVGIIRTLWMTHDELRASQPIHRSPQVLKCVEDYLAGQRFPLSVLSHL